MMFWGRERLAEMNYEWAVEEMNKPKPDRKRAIWFLNAATGLNPKFIEAVNMKQELTGKEITSVDNSTVRHFVRRSVLNDGVPATQPAASVTTILSKREQEAQAAAAEAAKAAEAEALAAAPTTMPATMPVIAEFCTDGQGFAMSPATQPTTQPTDADAADDGTVVQVEGAEGVQVLEILGEPTTAPSSQPADLSVVSVFEKKSPTTQSSEEELGATSITELPSEELPGNDPQEMPDNK
jgi:hypothetical protein